mgnify:FL=1
MLYFSKPKIFLILACLFAGIIFSFPNLYNEESVNDLPDFFPKNQLNLGLDLQGGSHLLLEVEVEAIVKERLENLLSDMRLNLREARIGYSQIGVKDDYATVVIRDAAQLDSARDVLNELSMPITTNLFSGASTKELEVEDIGNGRFNIKLTEAALQNRVLKSVEQSIEIVRRRIDELGTTEPSIQRQGTSRILVQVPGLDDPERLKALLGQTAKMNFHLLDRI